MLSQEELDQTLPAETTLYPTPIPTQCVSSDEYMPCPQTEKQREFAARLHEYGGELARRQGLTRRQFFKSAAGMAAAFVAMNETYGPLFAVSRAEAATPEMADERAKKLKGQFIMDMHTHFLRDDTPIKTFIAQRATVGKLGWNPRLGEKEQTIEDLKFANYFKEIFLDSDTKVACISGSYSVDEKYSFLTNEMKFDAREKVNREAGTRRMFSHAIVTPGRDGWLDKVEEEQAKLRPDSWKGYTIGDNTNKHLSKWPWRLDDEKVTYPFYEKLVKWSKSSPTVINVCIHKGLFPPEIEKKFPHLLEYSDVRDVGKAARDWPQLNFIIYHSGWRWTGPNAPKAAWEHFEKTGRIEWVTDLAEIPSRRRAGQERDLRRQQRAALQLQAADAGGGADRPHRADQGDVRAARRRSQQSLLRLRPQAGRLTAERRADARAALSDARGAGVHCGYNERPSRHSSAGRATAL